MIHYKPCSLDSPIRLLNSCKCFSGINTLPQEILPLLEPYSRLILWFGNSPSGLGAIRQFSKKLHEERCFMIKFVFQCARLSKNWICFYCELYYRATNERPSEFVDGKADLNIASVLKTAEPILHECITTFSKLRQEVWAEMVNTDSVK